MKQEFGSPRFYELTQEMRDRIGAVTARTYWQINKLTNITGCSIYDGAIELIASYLRHLSITTENVKADCEWVAAAAITAMIYHHTGQRVSHFGTLTRGMTDWLHNLDKLHAHKNHDYSYEHPLSNFMVYCAVFNMPLHQAGIIALIGKKERLRTIKHRGQHMVKEDVTETLRDIAVYAFLTIIMAEVEEQGWDRERYRKLAWEYLGD